MERRSADMGARHVWRSKGHHRQIGEDMAAGAGGYERVYVPTCNILCGTPRQMVFFRFSYHKIVPTITTNILVPDLQQLFIFHVQAHQNLMP